MAWAAGNRYYRQKITISGANVAGDVTDFPVAINIPAGNDVFSEADTSGTDILFAASNGFTLLDFERSVWDKTQPIHGIVIFLQFGILKTAHIMVRQMRYRIHQVVGIMDGLAAVFKELTTLGAKLLTFLMVTIMLDLNLI